MNLMELLRKRKKEAEEAGNMDMEETPEQRKERLEKALNKSTGTFKLQ